MTIDLLRGMNRRDFATSIKGMNKADMVGIIKAYGVFVSISKKTSDVLEVLMDCIDGVLMPSEKDAKKLSRVSTRVKLTDSDREIIASIPDIKSGLIMCTLGVGNNAEGKLKECKKIFRAISLKLHPDKASIGIKKYKSDLYIDIKNIYESSIKELEEKVRKQDPDYCPF